MYGCPGCGSMMTFDIPGQQLKCISCGRTEAIEEADRREARKAGSSFAVDVLTCPTCGAQIRSMNTAQAAFCSYCGASVLLDRREAEMEAPDTVAPFRITREECFEKYRSMVRKSLCADRKLKKEVTAESFRGIYVPHYVYSAAVRGETVLEGTETKGNDTYYYNTSVTLNHRYNNILHDASREMPDTMSEKIAKVEEDAFRPFSPAYLSGFYADVPDTEKSAYIPFAKAEAVRMGLQDVMSDLEGGYHYATGETEKKLVKMAHAECTGRTLVPVWFMSIRSGNRLLYAVQNAVTGEMTADIPMDIPRFGLIALAVAALVFLLLNSLNVTLRPEMVLMVSMLLALCAQWLVNRHRSSIRERETEEGAIDGNDNLAQRLKQRKKMASHAKGSMTGVMQTIGGTVGLVVLLYGLTRLAELNNAKAFQIAALVMTAVLGGLMWWGSRTRVRTPIGCWAALIITVLGMLNLIVNPFHSDDLIMYLLSFACLLSVVWVCVDVLTLHNRACSNPMPQFETHQGGDDRA